MRHGLNWQQGRLKPPTRYPPAIKHGVLEIGPFIADVPFLRLKTIILSFIYGGFSIAMFDYQRVIHHHLAMAQKETNPQFLDKWMVLSY